MLQSVQLPRCNLKYLEKSGNLMQTGKWPPWMQSVNNNDNNNQDDIYSAIIMTRSLQEFTRFIWWMEQCQAAVDPQTKPRDLACEFASRQLSSTTTIAIYYYYSARKLIPIYHPTEGKWVTPDRREEWEHFHQVFINEVIWQWRPRLRACIPARGGHFEHRL